MTIEESVRKAKQLLFDINDGPSILELATALRNERISGPRMFRVVSDGTREGTTVFGPDGNPIRTVAVAFRIDARDGGLSTMEITTRDGQIDAMVPGERVTVCAARDPEAEALGRFRAALRSALRSEASDVLCREPDGTRVTRAEFADRLDMGDAAALRLLEDILSSLRAVGLRATEESK
jgi:hypothetical protein